VIYQDDGSHPFVAKSIGSFGYYHQDVPGIKSRDALATIYATPLDAHSVELVRALLLSVSGATTAAYDSAASLTTALR
jgi:hypothetical protein